MPEYGGWMIEAVPTDPYMSLIDSEVILSCENKLVTRRKTLQEFLRPFNIYIVSLTNCMHIGTKNGIYIEDDAIRKFVTENYGNLESINEYTQSIFLPDVAINSHPRFPNLSKSIRERRGEKINITVPIYQDTKTNMEEATDIEPYPGKIYMDAMGFGMGQCCL